MMDRKGAKSAENKILHKVKEVLDGHNTTDRGKCPAFKRNLNRTNKRG